MDLLPGFIDHVAFEVADLEASRRFYAAALAPWASEKSRLTVPSATGHEAARICGSARGEPGPPLHLALVASDRTLVDAFHAAGLDGGGRDNGAPGIRAQYHPEYYAAYLLDPDGNNVEAVHHGTQPQGF